MNLEETLPQLVPLAVAWAEDAARTGAEASMALDGDGEALARSVGVTRPESVRVALVTQFPEPQNPQLRAAARQTGLLGASTMGLTLGHTIFIRKGKLDRRILSHELRHVHQYEQAGSITQFLPVYLQQIIACGYRDAPFEVDARAHEVRVGP